MVTDHIAGIGEYAYSGIQRGKLTCSKCILITQGTVTPTTKAAPTAATTVVVAIWVLRIMIPRLAETGRVTEHHRVVERVGVSVHTDSRFRRIGGIWLNKPPERRIVVPGMQVHEPGLVVVALPDVALAR